MLNKKALQEENEVLKLEIEQYEKAIQEFREAEIFIKEQRDEARKALAEEGIKCRAHISDVSQAKQEIRELKRELGALTDVKTIMAELKKCISAPNKSIEDKNNSLIAENDCLKCDLQDLQAENNRLTQEFQRLGYLEGKIEAYERMLSLSQSRCPEVENAKSESEASDD